MSAPPPQPTSKQCTAHAAIAWIDPRTERQHQGFACWYPQMGGYGSTAVVEPCGTDSECFDVWVWHDGAWPFEDGDADGREVRHLHHCMAEQFIWFGELVQAKMATPMLVPSPSPRNFRQERDAAYRERNQLVAALARVLSGPSWGEREAPGGPAAAWLAEHDPADVAWDPEWRTIVFIDGPTGQMSWHLHDSDVSLFEGLPRGPNKWDGHTTPEKYVRLARLGR